NILVLASKNDHTGPRPGRRRPEGRIERKVCEPDHFVSFYVDLNDLDIRVRPKALTALWVIRNHSEPLAVWRPTKIPGIQMPFRFHFQQRMPRMRVLG